MNDTTLMMVTYNRLDLTKKTLDDLKESIQQPYNLVVVDNGSIDGTPEWLTQEFGQDPTVHLILLPNNTGIAVGRNIALRRADEIGTKWYCTLDNDVLMPEGWLEESIDILSKNKGYGMIGVNMEGVQYPIVNLNGCSFEDKPRGNLGTACMVFTKQVHQMLGFFNTEYGMYGEEDADFGMRARVVGLKLGYISRMGTHLGSDESDKSEYRMFKTKAHADNLALFRNNCVLYMRKEKPVYVKYKACVEETSITPP